MTSFNPSLCLCASLLAAVLALPSTAGGLPPDVEELRALLETVHERVLDDRAGTLPDYIPALTEVDPEHFAIAVVTVDGRAVSVGDAGETFAIMSAAKPFTAALVMKQRGRQIIRDRIGVEPTGEAFNSINVIEENPLRTVNPLVNAGAMATVSLIEGESAADRWQTLLDWYGLLADASLNMSPAIYRSVREGGLRNRAVAALLKDYGHLYGEPEAVRDLYNRQSAVLVTTRQLAMMGATLANGGVQPATGQRLLAAGDVTATLALMTMAGMYDGAGAWAWEVGLPAKSGVGGGIVAVAPDRLAVAAFSPRLDDKGNSVRAQAAIRELSAILGLGLFGPVPSTSHKK